jgi:hypothetical protein
LGAWGVSEIFREVAADTPSHCPKALNPAAKDNVELASFHLPGALRNCPVFVDIAQGFSGVQPCTCLLA